MRKEIIEWFSQERGIETSTLEAFGVTEEQEWIVFPYSNQNKLRTDPTKSGKRLFLWSERKSPDLFRKLNEKPSKAAFIVEGETDTLRLWQALREAPVASEGYANVYGVPGIETWKPHFADYFENHEKVYVVLDNDPDYNVKARVDNAWKDIRYSLGAKARRVVLPTGIKDICEFFDRYELSSLRELVSRASRPSTKLKRLDLTKEPSPMDWLVEGLICSGDVNLLVGAPGLGKSFLMKSLALAVAKGDTEWLDFPLKKHGKVLYIDEENPEDIIFHRFKKLGINKEAADNIHYVYRPGIWVNKEPDVFLEEAAEINPLLIVLDSLSRLHSEDENNANAMARLFREGIVPLARDTNSAVVVIHHTVKGDTTSDFQRSRGSGDITAVVDAALSVTESASDSVFLKQFKSRRGKAAQSKIVSIVEEAEKIRILAKEGDLPF